MSRRAVAVALGIAASQCTDSTGPSGTNLSVLFANAGTSDRAMLFEVATTDATARIDAVLPVPGSTYRVFVQRQSDQRWRVIVTGALSDGKLAVITVPSQNRTSTYTGRILDVADASFTSLQPGSRTLSVTP